MLFRLSEKIVLAWSDERLIEKGSEEAYVYGVQLLLSTLLNTIVIAVISAIADRTFAWIFFLVGFVPIRITAGGFHAKTPFRCSTLFCGSYFLCILLLNVTKDDIHTSVIIINSLVAMLVVYLYSPLPASNKPMSEEGLERKRVLSLAVTASLLLIIVISIQLQVAFRVALYISFGEMVASIFCFAAKHCKQKN